MKITVAIVLGVLIAADTCVDDIKAATANMTVCGISLVKALSDCWTYPHSCTPNIGSVVESLDAATKFVNDAVTDCGRQNSTCTEDLANLATKLGHANKDNADAVKNCATGGEKCYSDLVKTTYDTLNAVAYIFKTTSECSFQTISMDTISVGLPNDECKSAIKEALEDITTIAKGLLPAVISCVRKRENCDQLSDTLEEALGSLESAISVCSGVASSCVYALGEIVREFGITRTAIKNAREDCSFGFNRSCRKNVRISAVHAFKLASEIFALRSQCKHEIDPKISA